MNTPQHIAIIGAGAAGASATRALRRLDYTGQISLIDMDLAGSYERPPLTKAGLINSTTRAQDFALLKGEELSELKIDSHFGEQVESLNASARSLTLQSGKTISADKILLALGGGARELAIEGSEAPGIYTLRDFADLDTLRGNVTQARHITVIGGGLIGAECVASLLKLGKQVRWLDAAPAPLSHILPDALATELTQQHIQAGAELIRKASLTSFETNSGGVVAVQLSDGARLPTDLVIVGIGMVPRLNLAKGAGLAMEAGGVRVDDCQETSAAGIFAAGDMAAIPHGQGWKREEHWRAAEVQGEAAAYAMLGLTFERPDASWFWSDQGDHHVEMVGRKGERSVLRIGEGTLANFEFEGRRLVGAASLNDPNAVRVAVRLLKAEKSPSETALADPTQDLRKLLRA